MRQDKAAPASFILLASNFDERAPAQLKESIGEKFAELPPRRVFLYKKMIGRGHTAWPLLGAKLIIDATSFDERLAIGISVNGRKPIFIYNPIRPSMSEQTEATTNPTIIKASADSPQRSSRLTYMPRV